MNRLNSCSWTHLRRKSQNGVSYIVQHACSQDSNAIVGPTKREYFTWIWLVQLNYIGISTRILRVTPWEASINFLCLFLCSRRPGLQVRRNDASINTSIRHKRMERFPSPCTRAYACVVASYEYTETTQAQVQTASAMLESSLAPKGTRAPNSYTSALAFVTLYLSHV